MEYLCYYERKYEGDVTFTCCANLSIQVQDCPVLDPCNWAPNT